MFVRAAKGCVWHVGLRQELSVSDHLALHLLWLAMLAVFYIRPWLASTIDLACAVIGRSG